MTKYLNTIFLLVTTTIMGVGSFSFAQNADTLLIDSDSLLLDADFNKIVKYKSNVELQGIEKYVNYNVSSALMNNTDGDLNIRKAPAVMTVYTDEDIFKLGVKDIREVLTLISEVDFGVDVINIQGVIMRGMWSNEGKILVLLDGEILNENFYGSANFNNGAINIEAIKKIEVIRGPSAINFGGLATNGVISIVTKNAYDHNSLSLGTMQSAFTSGGVARTMYYANGGVFHNKNLSFVLNSSWGQQRLGGFIYTDVYGNSFDTKKSGFSEPVNFNTKIKWKNTELHSFININNLTAQDGYIQIYTTALKQQNYSAAIDLKQKFITSDNSVLISQFSFNNYAPYKTVDTIRQQQFNDSNYFYFNLNTKRILFNNTWNYSPFDKLDLLIGGIAQIDLLKSDSLTKIQDINGNLYTKFNTKTFSAFSQVYYKLPKLFNVFAGVRYEYNSFSGSFTSAKLALTNKYKRFHWKLLGATTFKTPLLGNIILSKNGDIQFETGKYGEFELGYVFNNKWSVTINQFFNEIKSNLTYIVDNLGNEGYINSLEPYGSRGNSLNIKYKSKKLYTDINYTFSDNGDDRFKNSFYSSNTIKNIYLGTKTHRATLRITYDLTPKSFITATYIFNDKTAAITKIDSFGLFHESVMPATHLINLYIGSRNLIAKNFNLGIGMTNILNQKVYYAQPYKGGHAPLPQMGREVYIKMNYIIPENRKKIKALFGDN